MATVAQIRANRLNAQKSTGPRTAQGKERASQNAIKHGLLAKEAVVRGEDPEEFEVYREQMLEDLDPARAVETMLAERVVGLSWRLLWAERLQNAAFEALDDSEPTDLLEERLDEWKQVKGNAWDRAIAGEVDENLELSRVVVADFAEARVLDRLLMYERRIESSLYRTMAQLRKLRESRQTRQAVATQGVSRSENYLATGQEPAAPAKLASFGAEGVPTGKSQASSGTSDFPPQTSHFKLEETNPILGNETAFPGSIGGGKCGIGVSWMASDAAGSRTHAKRRPSKEGMAHGTRNDVDDA